MCFMPHESELLIGEAAIRRMQECKPAVQPVTAEKPYSPLVRFIHHESPHAHHSGKPAKNG